jgi:hypothetical protein
VTDVPVLLLAWRRPELTERVLAAIAEFRPTRLFLACDGWDASMDDKAIEAVRMTRAVLDRTPTWPCQVHRRYADRRLGLRTAVSGAIDWFFEECEEGIILEDDCLPSEEFFEFCAVLLARYRHDEQVMAICGDNSARVTVGGDSSYTFVRYPLPWGWATWRRAWERYDADLESAAVIAPDGWERLLPDPAERRVWLERMEALRGAAGPDSWDFVWGLSMIARGGLAVQPSSNLVSNLGYGSDATHTVSDAGDSDRASAERVPIFPLTHPVGILLDEIASRNVFDLAFGGLDERARFAWEGTARARIRRFLSKAVGLILPRGVVARARRRRRRHPWRVG